MSPSSVFACFSSRRLGALPLLAPLAAFAAEAPPPPPGVSFATMMQTLAALALILGLFVGAAWLLRKINGGKAFMDANGPLKVLSAVTVGARERIILVEIENTWLVIGVAPGQVRTLHTQPKGTLPVETADAGQFGQWLKQFREQRNEAKK